MSHRVCPCWAGYLLASPIRKWIHDPDKILSSYVKPGMVVLEIGPGIGFFSLPLAKMVGSQGKVVCVDVQEKMIQALQKRLTKAQLAERTVTRVCRPNSLDIDDYSGKIDFVLLFAVVHEIPDISNFFEELVKSMNSGSLCLLSEPRGHVSIKDFDETLAITKQKGLTVMDTPIIKRSHSAILRKE